MNQYKVQQKAVVWYEVDVLAESIEQAQELAEDSLRQGDGHEVEYTFEWVDATCVLAKGENSWNVVREMENA